MHGDNLVHAGQLNILHVQVCQQAFIYHAVRFYVW